MDSGISEVADETLAIDSAIVDTSTAPEDVADTSVTEEVSSDAGDATSDEVMADASDSATVDGGTCKSGTVQEEACGKCGTRSRLCDMSAWLPWSACGEESGVCVPGETRDVACERCGTRKETCSTMCAWESGACLDQKGCVAGSAESRTGLCLDTTKVQTRTCTETCTWSSWSDC